MASAVTDALAVMSADDVRIAEPLATTVASALMSALAKLVFCPRRSQSSVT
jgi:hypothetical protein